MNGGNNFISWLIGHRLFSHVRGRVMLACCATEQWASLLSSNDWQPTRDFWSRLSDGRQVGDKVWPSSSSSSSGVRTLLPFLFTSFWQLLDFFSLVYASSATLLKRTHWSVSDNILAHFWAFWPKNPSFSWQHLKRKIDAFKMRIEMELEL